jgi:hypothetical protein
MNKKRKTYSLHTAQDTSTTTYLKPFFGYRVKNHPYIARGLIMRHNYSIYLKKQSVK